MSCDAGRLRSFFAKTGGSVHHAGVPTRHNDPVEPFHPCIKDAGHSPTCTVHGCFLLERSIQLEAVGLPVAYFYCPVGKMVVRETEPTSVVQR